MGGGKLMDSEMSKTDWNEKSYIAERDRSRGGIVLSRAPAPAILREYEKEELEEKCLELISKDPEQLCISIYPLSDGQYAVSSAQKVQGTKREARKHDVVHGVILSETELEEFCENVLAEGKAKEFFFPEQPKEKEERAETDKIQAGAAQRNTGQKETALAGAVQTDVTQEWNVTELMHQMEELPEAHALEDFKNGIDFRQLQSMFRALKMTYKGNYKIQLHVKEQKEVLLAALIQMSVAARLSLSFLLGGETTVFEPNILLAEENELEYMDQNIYEGMTFDQLLSRFRQRRGPRWKNAPEREKWMKELLDLCEDYLDDELLEYKLYQKVGQLKRKDRDLFSQFQMELRVMLTGICGKKKYQKRYIELVYLAFKKEISAEECMSAELTQAPYDYAKMITFLQKKAVTKTEAKRLMMKMLETPFDECLGRNVERVARKAARRTVRNYI